MEIEEDPVEEVARVWLGWRNNNIPDEPIQSRKFNHGTHREADLSLKRVKTMLNDKGYQEVITYSFVDPKVQQSSIQQKRCCCQTLPPLRCRRCVCPVERDCWRRWSITKTVSRMRVFLKLALRFRSGYTSQSGYSTDSGMLAGVICGNRYDEHWNLAKETVDFCDLKGDLKQY